MSEQFARMRIVDLPATRQGHRLMKRAMDLSIAIPLLIIAGPLMLVIAVLVRATSRGAAIFKQRRVGLNGDLFMCYKFRSMVADADAQVHKDYVKAYATGQLDESRAARGRRNLRYKLTNDNRVTPLGKFLRRSSFDELPQLFNVLKGEMSMVGPRPDVPYSVELYKDWHRIRLEVKPGITGLWQVKGRSTVTFEEMMRLDVEYVLNPSIWNDIKILLVTIPAVLLTRGAV